MRKELGQLAERILNTLSIGHVLREIAKRFPARVQAVGERHSGLTKWQVVKL